MPYPPAARLWNDGQWEVAKNDGQPRFSQPFAGDNGEYILDQDYVQLFEYFSPLELNTAHPLYPDYYLCSESPHADIGCGAIKWTRRYCKIPATRSDGTSMTYKFPAYYGAIGFGLDIKGRLSFTMVVTCRVQYDYYFVLNPTTVLDANGNNVFTAGKEFGIPVLNARRYIIPLGGFIGGVFVPLYPVGSDQYYANGVDATDSGLTDIGETLPPTDPTIATYKSWIGVTEVVAEDSQVSRWQGNIFVRATKYVIAK